MINKTSKFFELSNKYGIPVEDLFLVDLNLSGVQLELQSGRVRFELESTNNDLFPLAHSKGIRNFYLAVPTSKDSSYKFHDSNLVFNETVIGKALGVTEDYCDSSYPRRGGTVLNINPNARTSCRGCKFCYTVFQVPRDRECMLTEDKLRDYLVNWMKQFEVKDLSHLLQVAVVTGCFPT